VMLASETLGRAVPDGQQQFSQLGPTRLKYSTARVASA
jgi:hypothetical protein